MFIARVVGSSMEPLIPANSYCLFREARAGSRQGKRVLVWHAGVTDADTGGQFTVKVYESEKQVTEEGWQHTRITLRPLNPDFEPIELTPREAGDVRVLAEFVEVVGAAPVIG
jgi:phage repressor protein C with HTH and peptisase S24 domain